MKGPSLRTGRLGLYDLPQTTDTVLCPRKGPLGSEISLVICGQLNEAHPDSCKAMLCHKAAFYALNIRALKLMTRNKGKTYKEIFRMVEEGRDLVPGAIPDEDPDEDLLYETDSDEDCE